MAKGFTPITKKSNQPELYKIEEECTTGWEEYKTNLTKQEVEAEYEFLINEGYAPSRIKIIRIQ